MPRATNRLKLSIKTSLKTVQFVAKAVCAVECKRLSRDVKARKIKYKYAATASKSAVREKLNLCRENPFA